MHYLVRSLALRNPASLNAATLFDRPYRRLVDDLPVRYVGFTIPDEFFVGYGFDLDERLSQPARPAFRATRRLRHHSRRVLGMAKIGG